MGATRLIGLSSSRPEGPLMWNLEGGESRVNYRRKVAGPLDREDLTQTPTLMSQYRNADEERQQRGAKWSLLLFVFMKVPSFVGFAHV